MDIWIYINILNRFTETKCILNRFAKMNQRIAAQPFSHFHSQLGGVCLTSTGRAHVSTAIRQTTRNYNNFNLDPNPLLIIEKAKQWLHE